MCERVFDTSYAFIIEDVNFDGQNDIRLISWTSIQSDKEYWYWLFNPKTGKFEKNSLLERFMNPEFDQELKTVYTRWRSGVYEYGQAIYKWQNNNCLLEMEQVQYMNPSQELFYLDTYKRINGVGECQEKEMSEYIEFSKKELFNLWLYESDSEGYSPCKRLNDNLAQAYLILDSINCLNVNDLMKINTKGCVNNCLPKETFYKLTKYREKLSNINIDIRWNENISRYMLIE